MESNRGRSPISAKAPSCLVALLPILSTALLIVLVYHYQYLSPQRTAAPGCLFPTSTYHVSGRQILDEKGNAFVPYGVQLDGILMANADWKTDGALARLTYDQLLAARDFWHANTVSLQLGSRALFAHSPYDSTYLAAVDQTVSWADRLGMNIILVLQYEGFGNSFQLMPTQDSVNFWDILSRHYAHNHRVFFDVFNEPNPGALLGTGDTDRAWTFWHDGGTVNGTSYVGFQQLVNTIRKDGVQNLIFAEGLAAGEDLQLLPSHTLSGTNIVYAIHPYLNAAQHHTPSDWNRWFGNTVAKGNFPVVADEWAEYQSGNGECVTDAPTVVPQFLDYLKARTIGLVGYALWPGTLIRGWNFRNPTTYARTTTTCPLNTPDPNFNSQAEGTGHLLVQYFAANSAQVLCSTVAKKYI
jgi:Cellulase (glycosyl hydrolase family 5)